MEKNKAVAIFDLRAGQREKVRVKDVVVLINFLYTVMWAAWKGPRSRNAAAVDNKGIGAIVIDV